MDNNGHPIYHTNVVLSIGEGIAIVCLESIPNLEQVKLIRSSLEEDGMALLTINKAQMQSFCANILQVQNKNNKKIWVMSQTAFDAFSDQQRKVLEQFGTLLIANIATIESAGGGSVCRMMTEIFLKPKSNE